MELAPEPEGVGRLSYSILPLFIPLIWVSYFMVPNKMLLGVSFQQCNKDKKGS